MSTDPVLPVSVFPENKPRSPDINWDWPELICRCPLAEEPAPVSNSSTPAEFVFDNPVVTDMLPPTAADVNEADPPLISMEPTADPLKRSPDAIETLPLERRSPFPPNRAISPPDAPDAPSNAIEPPLLPSVIDDVTPAESTIDDPTRLFPAPAISEIDPAEATLLAPETNSTAPVDELCEEPVLNERMPWPPADDDIETDELEPETREINP